MGLKPQGYLCLYDWDGRVTEVDTFTCRHCQRIVKMGDGGYCRSCDSWICDSCVDKDCVPFMRRIEKMEEQYYRRRQFEKVAGL